MKILHNTEKYFWVCLMSAILLGFIFPQPLMQFEGQVLYIIMSILFLIFLKVDLSEVIHFIKRPILLLHILSLNLIFIPLITFFIFKPLDPELTMGLLLLAALPSGVSSAAFTDIMEGHTSLSLTIILFSTLIAPITIPALFLLLYKTDLALNYWDLTQNLLLILFIPLIASQLCKGLIKPVVEKGKIYFNAIVIALLSCMIMVTIAIKAEYIMANFSEIAYILGILYAAFFIFQLLSYFGVFWLKKGEKVAVSNSKTIMNNILGIVLALAFFSEKVELIVILSLIPWNTMIIVFHWYKRYLP